MPVRCRSKSGSIDKEHSVKSKVTKSDKVISKNRSRSRSGSKSAERHRRRRVEESRDCESKRGSKWHKRSRSRPHRSSSRSREIKRKRYEDTIEEGNTSKRKCSETDNKDKRSDDDKNLVAKKSSSSRKHTSDKNLTSTRIDKDVSNNTSRSRSKSVERQRRRRIEESRGCESKSHKRSRSRQHRSSSRSREIKKKSYEDTVDEDNTSKRSSETDSEDKSDDDKKLVAKHSSNGRKYASDKNLARTKIDEDVSKNTSRGRSRSKSAERHRRRRVEESRDCESKRGSKSHKRSRSRHHRSSSRSREIKRKRYEDTIEEDHTCKRKSSETDSKDKRSDGDKNSIANKSKNTRKNASDIMTRTGGAYIPPARLRMMQEKITDKSSIEYQRIAWEALKKSINGLINKVAASNVIDICKELLQENIVRGRGLLAKSLMQAQSMSVTFSNVFAALAAVINSKLPQIGDLLVKRLILQFKRGFKRNNKALCLSSTRFIAHLYNQKVLDEIIPFEILILLLERPTNDSVEVAIGFLKECGRKLTDDSTTAIMSIFDSLKNILNEATVDTRVTYMIEVMFAIRKDGYKDYPTVISELDLVIDEDQFMHRITLEDDVKAEDRLNVFEHDPHYEENEDKYNAIKEEILGGDSEDEDEEDSSDEDEDEEKESGDETGKSSQVINDQTETNLVTLRKTIYLTIQSSLNHEECAHKLLKMQLKPGQEYELCNMIMDCSAQERTYIAFYGLLAQRFCNLDKKYVEPYEKIFGEQYGTAHRLETNKIRNIAKFFAHLLVADAISWEVLQCIKLNENDTTSSSRIFLKHLFQELSQDMGLGKLDHRFKDPTLVSAFEGIFPKSNPKDTRFSINFFTSIGLGQLTVELREHLKTAASNPKAVQQREKTTSSSSDSSSSSSSPSSSSSSSSSP